MAEKQPTFLSQLETHERLNVMPLPHQDAPLALHVDLALARLKTIRA